MRRRVLLALPILSLALLGSDCEGGVRVDTRPPEQRDGAQDTSGLVVVVKSGTSAEEAAAATSIDPRVLVQAALSVAAVDPWSPSIPEPMSTPAMGPDVSSWSLERSYATHEPRVATTASPIPEPAAVLLFGLGCALVLARSTAKTRSRFGQARDAISTGARLGERPRIFRHSMSSEGRVSVSSLRATPRKTSNRVSRASDEPRQSCAPDPTESSRVRADGPLESQPVGLVPGSGIPIGARRLEHQVEDPPAHWL